MQCISLLNHPNSMVSVSLRGFWGAKDRGECLSIYSYKENIYVMVISTHWIDSIMEIQILIQTCAQEFQFDQNQV